MDIYQQLANQGIDKERLDTMIQSEQWGSLVDAFGVLSVLVAVLNEWPEK